jgi:hypothetical protein
VKDIVKIWTYFEPVLGIYYNSSSGVGIVESPI